MIESTPVPAGTRVRLRPVHDFLTLEANTATVLGPGYAPGLRRIRLDQPERCHFGDDDVHDVQEMSGAIEHLELLNSWRSAGASPHARWRGGVRKGASLSRHANGRFLV